MRPRKQFWSWKRDLFPGKLFACSVLIFSVAILSVEVSNATAQGAVPDAIPPSEVWVPAEAVGAGASWDRTPRTRVQLVDYEESVTPDPVSPAPRLTDGATVSQPSSTDYSDPGLIVPIEQVGPLLRMDPSDIPDTYVTEMVVPDTIVPNGTMVPGSMRVLPQSSSTAMAAEEPWHMQILPSGLLWHSYLAGPREPRISSTFFRIKGEQDYWDATVGGRVSLLRFGTTDLLAPEGVEVQLEGAAFPRLTLDYDRDLVASDYRFGFPLVYRRNSLEAKFSYYHLSSHLGDEYLITHPEALSERINYSRDAFTLAIGYFPWRDLRLYGEVGYAVWCDGGSRPWEFQFGADYSPARPTGIWGAPFFALNGHLHQELNYSGGFTGQAGVQWRGQTGRLLRFGFQYFNGMSEQYQFYRQFEQQFGGGIWYDF